MDFSAFNNTDIAVLSIIILSVLFGFIRGFIGSFLSLTGWILSIIFAYAAFPYIKPYLEEHIASQVVAVVIGHALSLLVFLMFFGLLNALISRALKDMKKGFIDRIIGVLFGAFRGALIVSFFFFCVSVSLNLLYGNSSHKNEEVIPEWIKKAETYRYMKVGKEILAGFIPGTFSDRLEVVYKSLSKKNLDERFIANAIKQLSQHVSENDLKAIEEESAQEAFSSI